MPTNTLPIDYLNSLSKGAIVVKDDNQSLNHQIVFVNDQFAKEIGYGLGDIPDKNAWWITAYPDEAYQKVVARQWELAVETFNENEGKYVVMDAQIQTKSNGSRKFRVYSEARDHLIPGHYVVMFEQLN